MNDSIIQQIIEKLEKEYDLANSVESKSILVYLIGLLKNNYLIKEKNLLEKFYIKGILQGIDSFKNDNDLKSFDDIYNDKKL
jgi:hypothetical protein